MFGLFDKIKERFVNDTKNWAIKQFEQFKKEFLDMASTLDLDKDGVKDMKEIEEDLNAIRAGLSGAYKSLAGMQPHVSNLLNLAGIYYLKFGPQKPSVTVAQLAPPAAPAVSGGAGGEGVA